MKLTFDILDVEHYEARKYKPATLVQRQGGESWLVRDRPIGVEGTPQELWGWCTQGDKVRVPMYPYITGSSDASTAIGLAFEMGFRARDLVPDNLEIQRLHIVVGSPVQTVTGLDGMREDQAVLRFWIGFAYVVREKS